MQLSEHLQESPVKADGGRWVSAEDGYELAKGRGFTKSIGTLRRLARDEPRELEQRYGLRRIERPKGDTKSAAYEDLRWVPVE